MFFSFLVIRRIHLYIPKFSIAASYDVKVLLQKLGVTDVFNDNADLSGITGERNLMVSKVSMLIMLAPTVPFLFKGVPTKLLSLGVLQK